MPWLPLALAALGLVGLVMALLSKATEQRLPFTEALVALVLGVLAGPRVLDLVQVPDGTRDLLLLEGSRVLLAASVMAAALRFRFDQVRPLAVPTVWLLLVAMPLAALLTGLAGLALGLPLSVALVVGACLAPTDPVLAASVVTGESAQRTLPRRVRAVLTVESGANDGLGIVLVGVLVAAAVPASGVGEALALVAWEVAAGVLVGAVLGTVAGRAFALADRNGALGEGPELVFTLLLALGVLGASRLIGAGGVLAVFVAGLAYGRVVPSSPRQHQAALDEGINRYAVMPLVALLGLTLPWTEWADLGWTLLPFLLGVFLLRRPVVITALARPLGLRRHQAAFLGWFGPMGISALFYLAHARQEGLTDPRVLAAVTAAVVASVVVFGVTGTPGRRAYAARYGDEGEGSQRAEGDATG